MEKTVGTSPLLVLISLLIGYKLAGILGLLLAVPLVSAISLVITELYANQNPQNHDPELPLPLEIASVIPNSHTIFIRN
jgi:predicted PurR-regulated permease PerM